MVHETKGSFMDFTMTAAQLRDAVSAQAIDPARVRSLVDRLEERFAFFQHVLETGRRNTKPAEPEFARLDLAALVVDEAALVRGRFPAVADRVEIDVSGLERPLSIEADAGFLRQAIGNILKNAVEAYDGRQGPIRVVVTGRAGALDATLTVRDFGSGMHEDDVVRAFMPFGSSKPGGTGFGLYIARRCVRVVHGGSLALASALGDGTTVTMTLPLRQERRSVRPRARGRSKAS
jgi:signal transduction histidine kinase